MTEANQEETLADEQLLAHEREPVHRDLILQFIVGMASQTGVETPITLTVKGVYVSGYIVSGARFFDGVTEEMSKGSFASQEVKKFTLDFFKNFAEAFRQPEATKDNAETDPRLYRPDFIHLRAARFFAPGTVHMAIPSNGAWWRGRLDSVDGFFLGSLFPP
ncbi:MAG: gas vesicle accessory protein GvpU [Terriglobales bacterium]